PTTLTPRRPNSSAYAAKPAAWRRMLSVSSSGENHRMSGRPTKSLVSQSLSAVDGMIQDGTRSPTSSGHGNAKGCFSGTQSLPVLVLSKNPAKMATTFCQSSQQKIRVPAMTETQELHIDARLEQGVLVLTFRDKEIQSDSLAETLRDQLL